MSPEISHGDGLDIGIVDIVARHGPDEGIIGRAGARMDRPGRREHRLLVLHYDMARLLRLSHQMEDPGLVREVEIEIGLHTPVMHMAGHGVPDRAWRELRHSDDQLAGLDAARMDELENGTLIRR